MKAIRLQRFKGYRDSGWIDLRPPIILLLGANSSGKSALLNALLMLKQSRTDYSDNPFIFTTKEGVDIGNFEDAVFRHEVDMKKPMAFSFDVEVEKDFSEFGLSKGNSVLLSIKVAYNKKRRTNVVIGFDMVRGSDKKCILSMRKKSTIDDRKRVFRIRCCRCSRCVDQQLDWFCTDHTIQRGRSMGARKYNNFRIE
jgi:AAA15 family ATPase/GTPase